MIKRMTYGGVLLALVFAAFTAQADVRLKDIAFIKDQRMIQIKGVGLMTGLNGTGDGKNTQFTIRMISNMMRRMNIELPTQSIKVKNVAAVMVTATISPYMKVGGSFDVNVSSLGDAKSLEGGTLLLTPLSDSEDVLYGMAQGPVTLGGSNKDFGGVGGVVENDILAGVVPGGGLLEREVTTLAMDERSLNITLRNPDYTTVYRLASSINEHFAGDLAIAQDAGNVIVKVPENYVDNGDIVRFISEMELVTFRPDEKAKVVINERTGTIIAGNNVSLAPVAIMHGNLSLMIEAPEPAAEEGVPLLPAIRGQAGDRMVAIGESANVEQIARALNMLGVTPRDLIAIFQALKAAGSLRAELIII